MHDFRAYCDRALIELTRRRGDRGWDILLRVTLVVALVAILGSFLSSDCGALAAFTLLTMWMNGPHSPVLPATHEPVLMLYGRFYPPLIVGLVGTVGIVAVEIVNLRVYRWAGQLASVRAAREKKPAQLLTRLFRHAPFLAVVVAALGVFPLWIARALAAFEDYPAQRFLTATAIGRFPRFVLVSSLGAPLAIPSKWLVIVAVTGVAAGVAFGAWNAVHHRTHRPRKLAGDMSHVFTGMPLVTRSD